VLPKCCRNELSQSSAQVQKTGAQPSRQDLLSRRSSLQSEGDSATQTPRAPAVCLRAAARAGDRATVGKALVWSEPRMQRLRLGVRFGSEGGRGQVPPRNNPAQGRIEAVRAAAAHPDRWMVRTTQPSAARRVVKPMRRAGQSCESYRALAGLAWGDQLTGAPSLSGTPRGSSLRSIGTFITNARYWIGPVSGDPQARQCHQLGPRSPASPGAGLFVGTTTTISVLPIASCAWLPSGLARGVEAPDTQPLRGLSARRGSTRSSGSFPPSAKSSPRRSR
jgi:hypothetical protein